jgi:hypothetical protein
MSTQVRITLGPALADYLRFRPSGNALGRSAFSFAYYSLGMQRKVRGMLLIKRKAIRYFQNKNKQCFFKTALTSN